MTFHVALASNTAGVMVSDSQGSSATAETHGNQKQFVGDDYLLGIAGNMAVLSALLRELATGSRTNAGVPPNASNVESLVSTFMTRSVRPNAVGSIQVLLVAPTSTGYVTKTFLPEVFTEFGPEGATGMIGSGTEFAMRALRRDDQLGLAPAPTDLVDLFSTAESLAIVANESLTVDDQLFVGFLANGRSYMCGHVALRASLVPVVVRNHWVSVGQTFGELVSLSQALRSELREAQRLFSQIRLGPLSAAAQHQIDQSAVGIQATRLQLAQRLSDYCGWYDGILGR